MGFALFKDCFQYCIYLFKTLGMYRIILGIKTIFLLLGMVIFMTPAQAQLYLSENSYDGPIPQGPAGKVEAVQLLRRADNGRYEAPDVKTTFQLSISNPQIEADGISEVLSFGSNSRETLKWPSSEFVFKEMKSLGSPLSSFFTAGAQKNEGIMTTSNFGYWLFASVKHLSKSSFPKPGESQYLADLTMTFNRSVANPVIHLVGLGGIVTVEGIIRGFSVELELTHPTAYLEKVSGSEEFGVNPDRIYNVADRFDGDCGAGAACGSVKVIGKNLTELTFKVHLRRDVRADGYRGRWPLMRNMQGGDGFLVGVSFDENGTVSGQVNTITESGIMGQNKLEEKLLRVNLIDPANDKVLASKPVENNGSFEFDGLTLHNQYAIQLNTIKGMVGDLAPNVMLPDEWTRTDSAHNQVMAQLPHLFVLDSATQSGFDFTLTNLTQEKLAQALDTGSQSKLEKTPTEIYHEEREKLDLANKERQLKETTSEMEEEDLTELDTEPMEDTSIIVEPVMESENVADIAPIVEEEVEEEPAPVVAAEPEELPIEDVAEVQVKEEPASKNDEDISKDSDSRQGVIIVGSGQNEGGIATLSARLRALDREVYRGYGPNGMVRVGYHVSETNLDQELEWARKNIVDDAWILDEPTTSRGNPTDGTEQSDHLGDCLIIVGSFAQIQNVERMFQKVMDAGLTPYKGEGPGQLTRVGFYVDCIRRFQELAEARKNLEPESWLKPKDIN